MLAQGGRICNLPPPMAQTATVYTFEVELSDVDRGVYESLSFKAAQQPSETDEYFLTRVLAYCLEYHEGIGFSRGLAEPDEPSLSVRDLTGAIKVWVEIGSPSADRLHKASKASPRLVLYTHKDPGRIVRELSGEKIHRRDDLEIRAVDPGLLDGLLARLDRRMTFALTVTDGHVLVAFPDGESADGAITAHRLMPLP
jgi:uncharacterized protein YaeQ